LSTPSCGTSAADGLFLFDFDDFFSDAFAFFSGGSDFRHDAAVASRQSAAPITSMLRRQMESFMKKKTSPRGRTAGSLMGIVLQRSPPGRQGLRDWTTAHAILPIRREQIFARGGAHPLQVCAICVLHEGLTIFVCFDEASFYPE
jgi:hypothetical protein